jgi:hypothetical protein
MNDEKAVEIDETSRDIMELELIRDLIIIDIPQITNRMTDLEIQLNVERVRGGSRADGVRHQFLKTYKKIRNKLIKLDCAVRADTYNQIVELERIREATK